MITKTPSRGSVLVVVVEYFSEDCQQSLCQKTKTKLKYARHDIQVGVYQLRRLQELRERMMEMIVKKDFVIKARMESVSNGSREVY